MTSITPDGKTVKLNLTTIGSVSTTYTFTHDQPGVQTANGGPIGYNAVVEHVSARCAASPILSILYGEARRMAGSRGSWSGQDVA